MAMNEMRNMITHWIQNFETVRFAPGEDGSRILQETVDHFTVGVKPLQLAFDKK